MQLTPPVPARRRNPPAWATEIRRLDAVWHDRQRRDADRIMERIDSIARRTDYLCERLADLERSTGLRDIERFDAPRRVRR